MTSKNSNEDSITNKIQRFQHPTMEIGFSLNDNNGSDTDMTVGPSFFKQHPNIHLWWLGRLHTTVNINMNTVTEINTALRRQSLKDQSVSITSYSLR